MPAKNDSTGTTGLFKVTVDGKPRYQIDYRYKDAETRLLKRYKERLPAAASKAYAVKRAREVVLAAHAGTLRTKAEKEAAAVVRNAAERAARKPLLSEAFKSYLKWLAIRRPRAVIDRGHHMRRLTDVIGDMRCDVFTAAHVESFIAARQEAGAQNGTINRQLATLRHFVARGADGKLCGEVEIFTADQARKICRVQKLEEAPERIKWLKGDEGPRLFAVLPAWLHDLARAAALTGCRQGELRLLMRQNVDLESRWLTIVKTKTKRDRRLPIADELAELLARAMKRSKGMLVFTDDHGNPVSKDRVTHAFARCAAKAGLDDFHFHDLRHHFATEALAAGADLYTVQRTLGHTNPATTTKYGHVKDEAMRETMSRAQSPDAPRMPPVVDLATERARRAGGE